MRYFVLPLLLVFVALGAEEAPERPTARVGLGAFIDRYSDTTGSWKGWILTGDWFHDDHGPWSFSVVGTERPEGKGTQFTVAKDHAFGESSGVWASLSAGTGADFVPSFRGDVDLTLGVSGPWEFGVEGAWSRFRGGSTTTLFQAGPGWVGEVWSASARVQQMRYLPGQASDTGYLLNLRWGARNLRRWHSVRVGWGQGILDSLQPGGSNSTITGYYGGSGSGTGGGWGHGPGSGGTGTSTTDPSTGTAYPSLNEFILTTTSHIPFSKRLAIRVDLGWGQRESQFKMWTGSIQTLVTF